MAMVRWDPWGELAGMQRDMERIFSRLGTPARGAAESAGASWMPRVDVIQKDDDLVVKAEIPGMDPEDIDVSLTDNVLSIRGERRSETEEEGEGYLVRERSYGSFERSMMVPEGIDPASIRADYVDGVLEVTVPKALEEAAPKTTRIEIGEGE
jgi:HSP20 family protein